MKQGAAVILIVNLVSLTLPADTVASSLSTNQHGVGARTAACPPGTEFEVRQKRSLPDDAQFQMVRRNLRQRRRVPMSENDGTAEPNSDPDKPWNEHGDWGASEMGWIRRRSSDPVGRPISAPRPRGHRHRWSDVGLEWIKRGADACSDEDDSTPRIKRRCGGRTGEYSPASSVGSKSQKERRRATDNWTNITRQTMTKTKVGHG